MILIIELPPEIETALLNDARSQGRPAEAVAVDRLVAWYSSQSPAIGEGSPQEKAAIQEAMADVAAGRLLPFNPDVLRERLRTKYDAPDLSHLSREELTAFAEETLSRIDPEKIAEARRQGLVE